jgi:hypothetical protein
MRSTPQWVLYTHDGKSLVHVSPKKFKTKEDAEKAREKYPERERRGIGIGRSL